MINVVIQGLGFVGSASAFAIANKKNKSKLLFNVIGIDQNSLQGRKRINNINKYKFPFLTNDQKLLDAVKKSKKNKNILASFSKKFYSKANVVLVSINCDILIKKNTYDIDLDKFLSSLKDIFNNVNEGTLIIIQSTIPPGTTEKFIYPLMKKILIKRKINFNKVYLAHSYERVMPGKNYLNSFTNIWRVYAGINKISADKCQNFFSSIINVKKFPMTRLNNTNSSELAKILENSYRAVNIAFIQEWVNFAEEIKVNLYDVIKAIKLRPTHSNIANPGFGVGGYCLTKDPLFAKIASYKIFNKQHKFLFSSNAIEINKNMPLESLKKIKSYFNNNLKNKNILMMGVSYKEDIDDTRLSPSEIFFKKAKFYGANLILNDPYVKYWNELKIKINNKLPSSSKINCIIFCVNHENYKKIDFKKWLGKEKNKILIIDAIKVLTDKQISQINKLTHVMVKTVGIDK